MQDRVELPFDTIEPAVLGRHSGPPSAIHTCNALAITGV
jgi:hypothetical protein